MLKFVKVLFHIVVFSNASLNVIDNASIVISLMIHLVVVIDNFSCLRTAHVSSAQQGALQLKHLTHPGW